MIIPKVFNFQSEYYGLGCAYFNDLEKNSESIEKYEIISSLIIFLNRKLMNKAN